MTTQNADHGRCAVPGCNLSVQRVSVPGNVEGNLVCGRGHKQSNAESVVTLTIEYVDVGNDNTDALGWQMGAYAAICYDEGEHQGLHFLVPANGTKEDLAAARLVLLGMIDDSCFAYRVAQIDSSEDALHVHFDGDACAIDGEHDSGTLYNEANDTIVREGWGAQIDSSGAADDHA